MMPSLSSSIARSTLNRQQLNLIQVRHILRILQDILTNPPPTPHLRALKSQSVITLLSYFRLFIAVSDGRIVAELLILARDRRVVTMAVGFDHLEYRLHQLHCSSQPRR